MGGRGAPLMARIRSIKPEFWVSEQIAECSTNARLTFIGLWNFSDDNGVHPAKPKTLKAELFPMDALPAADVAVWIDELIRVGLVAEFMHEGEAFWHVTGWARHQKIDRPSFKYPSPIDPNSTPTRRGLAEHSSNTRRAPPPGVDRSGVESKGEEQGASPQARPAANRSDTGTRLPKDWTLTDELRAYCREKRPDLDPDDVAESFRLYWVAVPGTDGRKADWAAAFQGWVRKEHSPRGGGRRMASNPMHADDTFEESAT